MRKILSYAMCIVLCMVMLSGCGKKVEEEGTLVGVIFERGHGSAWGNQFYMEVCEDEIIQANYISENSADLVTEEHIAITSEQWQEICNTIEKMELKKVRSIYIITSEKTRNCTMVSHLRTSANYSDWL